jgi:hypothetical protein
MACRKLQKRGDEYFDAKNTSKANDRGVLAAIHVMRIERPVGRLNRNTLRACGSGEKNEVHYESVRILRI